MTTPENDRQMITAVLANDAQAFECLVVAHQKLVWHIIYRMVAHSEDTKDLSQEVFLRVFRCLEQFRFECALRTWIGRIAFSLALAHLRARKLILLADFDPVFAEQLLEHCISDSDLEQEQHDHRLRERMLQHIATLTPLYRTVVELFYYDELGVDDIAMIMQKPVGTIKNALFRARQMLRVTLTEAGVLP